MHGDKPQIASPNEYREKTKQYRQAWSKLETPILKGMTEALGVSFYKPVIDVTLAPYFGAKSMPLIIGMRPSPDRFVDVLTHELLHILLNDNNKYQASSSGKSITAEWEKLFGSEHDQLTRNHIPVHALHKHLYLNVLRAPNRLERDVDSVQKSPSYVKAWEYVDSYGYTEIIEKLKIIYDKI